MKIRLIALAVFAAAAANFDAQQAWDQMDAAEAPA